MTLSLLQVGLAGLNAAQGSLATASHNIANAGTAGYSRQEAVRVTAAGQDTGSGFFGSGVQIATVRRSYDQFLTGALQDLSSQSAADRARSDALSQLDALFADADLGIGAAMDEVFSAFGDVANRPADIPTRQVALARIDQLARRFNTVGEQLGALHQQAQEQLAADASQVNLHLSTLRELNARIQQTGAEGHTPNDLLDQRDRALGALGELLPVRAVAGPGGTLDLFTIQGAPLLVGQSQSRLEAAPLPGDPMRLGLQLHVAGNPQWLDTAGLASQAGGSRGSLAGVLAFRDQDLATVAGRLDTLARGFADALNAQHVLGVDAAGQPGQALLAYAAAVPPALPSAIARSLRAIARVPAQLATGQAPVPGQDPIPPGSDNRNALAMMRLAGQPVAGTATASQAYASLVGEVGTRVQSGREQAELSSRMAADAQSRKEAVSGVNLDEEAAALLQHQQAYQACARVLQTSQALFDALISATGR